MLDLKQFLTDIKDKTLDTLPEIKEKLQDKRVFLPLIVILLFFIFSG
jgi:hypothetical protein